MSILKGQELAFVDEEGVVTINWQQGLQNRSQEYNLCTFSAPDGDHFPVYIQRSYGTPATLKVDSALQFGVNDKNVFYVYHNKEQTPYQHRFRTSDLQKLLVTLNKALKMAKKIDLSWVVGDNLHDVE